MVQIAFFAVVLSLTNSAFPQEPVSLRTKYQQFLNWRRQTSTDLPTRVLSTEKDGLLQAEIHAVLPYEFSTLAKKLIRPGNWCEWVPVVLNVKACIYQPDEKQEQLVFYVGRKHYISLEKAFALKYQFNASMEREDYLHIILRADKGPLGTEDYLIEVEALDLGDKTFISVRTAYLQSRLSRFATKGYLSTLGRNKIGFTVVGGDADNPEYISGMRGIIERNAVRYYLALKAYLETQQLSAEDQRFAAQAERWFDLTEKYHDQLYEMDKAEYLEMKRREHLRQTNLQKKVSSENNP